MGRLIALAIGAAVVLFAYKSSGAGARRHWTDEDVEFCARVAILEAANGSAAEQGAIMRVALNRAVRDGASVREVVTSVRWPGGGSRGRSFIAAVGSPAGTVTEHHRSPLDYPQYPAALSLARNVVEGRDPVNIGSRTHFFHPGGMPRCDAAGAVDGRRICREWEGAGLRWSPSWAVSRRDGGEAEHEPIRVGRAVFS